MRYLPVTKQDQQEMLASIKVNSIDELYHEAMGEIMKLSENVKIDLPNHKSEIEVDKYVTGLGNKNQLIEAENLFIGAGCYNHHIPSSVNYITQRGEFLTSYTPYQPEIAQGNLQVIFEFQSIIANLANKDIANASMYDGATALAESALMAYRINKFTKKNIVIIGNLHPEYVEVLKTYTASFDIEITLASRQEDVISAAQAEADLNNYLKQNGAENICCVIFQNPTFYGEILALENLAATCKESKIISICAVNEILSLGMLEPAKEIDIVCGEAAGVGVGMNFGGAHLGFLATKKEYVRQMPGRLAGATVDTDGNRSFVLTLSAREQHIRRDKATSNICSNQGLCALAFTVHATLLGENGFKQMAEVNHHNAAIAYEKFNANGIKVLNQTFFNEFIIDLGKRSAKQVIEKMLEQGVIAGLEVGTNRLLVAFTELNTVESIDNYIKLLNKIA